MYTQQIRFLLRIFPKLVAKCVEYCSRGAQLNLALFIIQLTK